MDPIDARAEALGPTRLLVTDHCPVLYPLFQLFRPLYQASAPTRP